MSGRPAVVCLIGPGRVGSAVIDAVRPDPSAWQLHSVVVREPRPTHLTARLPATVDGERAVIDPDVDVVIDANSDTSAGFRLLRAALRAGKAAVTANKDLAARYGEHLHSVAVASGGSFGYDAAVCAALPVTTVLTRHCATDRITEIDGVFSGTCNFILNAMATLGLDQPEAVAEAQRLGYAEPDPSADISALDAARKTALIAGLASPHRLDVADVSRIGIEAVTLADHRRAADNGQTIRLISRITFSAGQADAWVAPIMVANTNPLAQATGPWINSKRRVAAQVLLWAIRVGERGYLNGVGRGSWKAWPRDLGPTPLIDVLRRARRLRCGRVSRSEGQPEHGQCSHEESSTQFHFRLHTTGGDHSDARSRPYSLVNGPNLPSEVGANMP